MHRLNIFAKLIQVSQNEVVFIVGYRKWKFTHQDKKVIYNLIYCYEKSIAGKYINLANKQIGDEVIELVESIGFFIDIEKGNGENSRSELQEITRLVANPMPYIRSISTSDEDDLLVRCNSKNHNYQFQETITIPDIDSLGFSELLRRRKSNRRFQDNVVDKESLFRIIHNGFGIKNSNSNNIQHHSTASAGAMYQIDLFLILFTEEGGIPTGKYFYSKKESLLGRLGSVDKSEFIGNCFFPTSLDYSKLHGMFIITGNIQYELEKYGHRTFLYQAIEAGSISQNMVITSLISGNLRLLQFGGYFEDPLKNVLNLDENRYILTSFLF